MRNGRWTGFFLVLWLAGLAAGQIAGEHRGLLVGGSNLALGSNFMLELSSTNQPTSLRTGQPGWPVWGNVFGMCMDCDNLTVLVPGILGTSTPLTLGLFRFDPAAAAVIGTLWSGPASPLAITSYANWTLDGDGNPVTIDNQAQPQRLARYDRFAGTWRHAPLPAGLGPGGGLAGLEWDSFHGGFLHAAWGASPTAPSRLYWTSPDGSSTVLLASADTRRARYGGTQVANGDWISSTCCTERYWMVKAGTTTWTPGPPAAGTIAYDVSHEKYAAPGRGVWLVNVGPQAVRHIDLITGTVTNLHTGTASTMPGLAFEVTSLHDADLATCRTGKSTWDLHINPGDGLHAGRGYLIAASIMPNQKPIVLADGREIYIGIDPLTAMSAAGELPPFFTGNHGMLDARGRGTARLDFSPAGTAANGVVLHFCAVVLDSHAPSGVAWVCDPCTFVVNVLP